MQLGSSVKLLHPLPHTQILYHERGPAKSGISRNAMATPSDATNNLAVLIDADNVSSKIMADLMAEVANYGTPSPRRVYGKT